MHTSANYLLAAIATRAHPHTQPAGALLTATGSSSGSGSARGCTDSANCMPLLFSMSVLTGTTLRVLRSSRGLALPLSRTIKRLRLLGGCTWAPFTRVSNTCIHNTQIQRNTART